MKKVNEANSQNHSVDSELRIGNEILDAEEYQFIHRSAVKQSPIMDLDAIQRAKFAIKPRVIEEVIVA